MKLTPTARAIIAHTGLHADQTIPEIAKRVRCKEHTVRYILNQCIERGLIHKRWVVDLMACGWLRYEIFFSATPGSQGTRKRMIDWLIKHELCTYLAEVGGEFDYELILLARSSAHIKEVFAQLNERCGHFCFAKVVAQHTRVFYFSRKYLVPHQMPAERLAMGCAETDIGLDETDRKILELLDSSPDISQRDIARRLGCTPLTVARRFEAMKSSGVIRGAMYSVASSHIGANNYILLIFARGFGPELADRLYQFCVRHPNCTNMKECLGSWDFEVGVEVLDYAKLRAIREEILESFSDDIVSITVLSRFTTLKYNMYPLKSVW